jgi:hypothetical protein
MADASEGNDMVTGFVQQAADQVDGLASRLENGGVDRMMSDVRDYARRKPGTFLLAAGVAGFLVGRLARNANGITSGSGNDGTGTGMQQFTPMPYAPSMQSPAQSSLTGVGIEPTVDPAIAAEAELPYLGGATPPDVYSDGRR